MSPNSKNQISHAKAQGLNRAELRKLGKENGVKIEGTNKPFAGLNAGKKNAIKFVPKPDTRKIYDKTR